MTTHEAILEAFPELDKMTEMGYEDYFEEVKSKQSYLDKILSDITHIRVYKELTEKELAELQALEKQSFLERKKYKRIVRILGKNPKLWREFIKGTKELKGVIDSFNNTSYKPRILVEYMNEGDD